MAETIRFLVERGVPVMGHVGLTPQSVNALGWFKAQGRDRADGRRSSPMPGRSPRRAPSRSSWRRWPSRSAARSPRRSPIPTIGIGASPACDGQVLVLEDMLGLTPRAPKFVKRYGELGPSIAKAVEDYASEVRARAFPAAGAHLSRSAKPPT